MSSSLHHSFNKCDAQAREYFWGYELSKDNPAVTWSFTEEDDDSDFMDHTLFLKQATLGSSAVHNERNIIQVETTNYESKEVKQPLFSLTSGLTDSFAMDISFVGKTPVIFRLIEGSGPVHISGQQLVEFPPEDDVTQDETELLEDADDVEDSVMKDKKAQKRKAPPQIAKSKKKGKMEVSAESDEDSEEIEEEEEEEMDDEEEEEVVDDDDDDDDDYESPSSKGKKTNKTSKGKEKAVKKGAKKVEKGPSKVIKKQVVKKTKK